MLRTYKYKIKPNDEQIVLLNKHFGSIRFIYNYFLNERKTEYETNKNSINYYDNAKSLTELKKQDDYIWLKEINSIYGQSQIENIVSILNNIKDNSRNEKQDQIKKSYIAKCVKWCTKNNLPIHDCYL